MIDKAIDNIHSIKLRNGNILPSICFGPGILTRKMNFSTNVFIKKIQFYLLEKNYCNAVQSCIEAGVRFIDYSIAYGREDLIAKALKESHISRKDISLTTRVSNHNQTAGNIRDCVLRSIERFHTDYIDLLMFHWPVPNYYVDTWKEIIKLRDEGICRNIGVANCHQHHIEELIGKTGVIPDINQVEIHPLFSQKELVKYCQDKGIQMEAYTPLARMDERMCKLPLMKGICKKYNKSISQIVLRWHVQNGVIPVFRSLNANRQKENLNIFDFELSEEDMSAIDAININSRLRYDPDNCDFSIL